MLFARIFSVIIILLTLCGAGNAQPFLSEFDQVTIKKYGQSELNYTIDHPEIGKTIMEIHIPRKEKYDVPSLLGAFSQSMLSRILGNSNSHQDMYFRIPSVVKFDENNLLWKANLYAFGNLEKIRTKKQEFENKKLLITNKNIRMDWGLDTWCTLEEKGKKIGGFSVKIKPFRDSNFLRTAYYSIEEKKDQSWVKLKHPFDSLKEISEFKDPDYGAIGLLENIPAVFLYYANQKKLWVFLQAIPVAFFKLEYTNLELLEEKGRIHYIAHQYQPELWIRNNYQEVKKAQIIRLALFSRLMIWALHQNEFNY